MMRRALIIKATITVALVLYFIHPMLPTLGSLIWLWTKEL